MYQNRDHTNQKHIVTKSNYIDISDQKSLLEVTNKLSYLVDKNSNSHEIQQAIEKIFKVKVTRVNTAIIRGKLKSFKGSIGYKKDIKKAIVTLADGNTIDSSLEIK